MNSQHSPERARHLRRYSPPPGTGPEIDLPPVLELMRPNGSFYRLERGANLIGTGNGYIVGIRDPNGVLRPLFAQRLIVKIQRLEIGGYNVVPLSLEEYRHYNFNSDITTNTDPYLQYIGVIRIRPV